VFQNPGPGKKDLVVMPCTGSGPLDIRRCEEGHDIVLWHCSGPDTEPCWFCGGEGKAASYWMPGYAAGWYYLNAARQAGPFPTFLG
jgi:hypothetical protein